MLNFTGEVFFHTYTHFSVNYLSQITRTRKSVRAVTEPWLDFCCVSLSLPSDCSALWEQFKELQTWGRLGRMLAAVKGVIESQNVLSWKGCAKIMESNSKVNGPFQDQTNNLGIINIFIIASNPTKPIFSEYLFGLFHVTRAEGKFLVSAIGNRRGQNPEGNKAPSFEFTWPHPSPFDPHKEETEQGNHRVVLIVHSWYLQYLFLWRLSSQHWLSQSYFVNHNITNFLSCW